MKERDRLVPSVAVLEITYVEVEDCKEYFLDEGGVASITMFPDCINVIYDNAKIVTLQIDKVTRLMYERFSKDCLPLTQYGDTSLEKKVIKFEPDVTLQCEELAKIKEKYYQMLSDSINSPMKKEEIKEPIKGKRKFRKI
jgi:hypothetical protein